MKKLISYNPATNEVLWQGADTTDVKSIIAKARQGFIAHLADSLSQRHQKLAEFSKRLTAKRDDFARLIAMETGKPLWDAKGEVAAAIAKVDLSIQAQQQRSSEQEQVGQNGLSSRLRHRPHGVLAVIGPYNFPLHLPNGHIIPALLAGNTVVFKPSEKTPRVGEVFYQMLADSGFDEQVFCVQGGREVGQSLTSDKQIDGILFTGSSHTGSQLHRAYAGNTGPVLALEMGGNNPLLLDEVVDEKAAIYQIIQSAYLSAGQRCTCARRLIIVSPSGKGRQALVDKLVTATAALRIDEPFADPQPFMGCLIDNAAADSLLANQKKLQQKGGKSLLVCQRLKKGLPFLTAGIIDMTDANECPDEEYFGPLLQIIHTSSLQQAIDIANDTQYGLSAGILTENDAHWQLFAEQIRAGIVNRNQPLTGAKGNLPFGGCGASGNHRPSAWYAADYCAYPQASIMCDDVRLPTQLSPGMVLS